MNRGFTLVELIIVIIIVGILAAVGISQYSLVVEKGRTAEAKVHLGVMKQLAYQYYLENGSLDGITGDKVDADDTCSAASFYRFWIWSASDYITLYASRCTSGGKTPNDSRGYRVRLYWNPSGLTYWNCWYDDDNSPCDGLL